ncbi:MAG: hypothetical protein ABSB63_22615 [Spirochaetia bacterium]|jgi:hypothetical protein
MGKKYRELWEHGNFGRVVMKQPDGTIVQYEIPRDLHMIGMLRFRDTGEAGVYLDEMEEYCDIVEKDKRFPANMVAAIRMRITAARKTLKEKGLDEAMRYLAEIPHLTAELEKAPLEVLGRYGKQKHKEVSSRGGSAKKFRSAIYEVMKEHLQKSPSATAKQIMGQLP